MFNKRAALGALCWTATALLLQSCNIGNNTKPTVTDGSITEDKISDEAVTANKIAANAVTSVKIKDGAITAAKLDPSLALSGATGAFSGNVTVGGTLGVTGASTLTGALTVGSLTTNAASTLSGATTLQTTTAGTVPLTVTRSDSTAYANGTSTIHAAGTSVLTANITAGSIDAYVGMHGESDVTTAFTVGQMAGLFGRVGLNSAGGAPTVTTAIGVDSELKFSADGTISNAYGFHTKTSYAPGPLGTITRYVGLYIENPLSGGSNTALNAGGAQYGVVADGSATLNFFAGKVGIGNVSPSNELDVTGTGRITGNLTLGGTVTATGITNDGTGTYLCYSGTNTVTWSAAACAASDRRLKKNIIPLADSLTKVLQLQGVSFDWKDEKKAKNSGHQIGMIAQDIQKQFPEAVQKNPNGFFSVNYNALIAPVVEAVKELYAKWEGDHKALEQNNLRLGQLEKKIEIENIALKAENKALKERLDKIEQALAQAAPAKVPAKKGRKIAAK